MHSTGLACTVGVYALFPMALGLANVVLILLVLLWFFGGQHCAQWREARCNPVLWALLGLYVIMLIGLLYSSAPNNDVLLHLKKYVKLLIGVVVMLLLTRAPRARRWALDCFTLAMGFIALSTWLNVWFLLPWSQTQNLGWGVTHHVFGDYITQNVMMSFFVFLALFRAFHAERRSEMFGWGLATVLSALTITHLSDGRTGYILLAVVLGTFVVTQIRGRSVFAALAGAGLALTLALVSSDTMRARFDKAVAEAQQRETDNTSSIGHRLYNYKTTPKLLAEKPLLGWGTGAYHTQICHVLDKPEQCPTFSWHPHNQYLFFAAEHGMVGLGLYLALLASMAWVAFRSTDPQARTLLLGLTVLLAVNSLFNSPLWSARESHFFTLMGALLASMAWASRRAGPSQRLT